MTPTTRPAISAEALTRTRNEEPKRRRRRRWTAEQKADLLARFATSGLSAAEFCRRTDLSAGTFSTWSRRSGASQATPRASAAPGFAEVRVSGAPPMSAAAAIVIHFGSDIRVTVPPSADPAWVGQMLRVARAS